MRLMFASEIDDEESVVVFKVKQGCILELMIFTIMFIAMLTDLLQNCEDEIPIHSCIDGNLFNL